MCEFVILETVVECDLEDSVATDFIIDWRSGNFEASFPSSNLLLIS